jgi:hypothetical protein
VKGWYLMVPPLTGLTKADETEAENAPLRDWSVLERFDSADSCERRAAQLQVSGMKLDQELLKDWPLKSHTAVDARWWATAIAHVECFASDDPRLAK